MKDASISDSMKLDIMDYIEISLQPSRTETFVKMPYNIFTIYMKQKEMKVKGWLKEFVKHKESCNIFSIIRDKDKGKDCNCGLEKALERRY